MSTFDSEDLDQPATVAQVFRPRGAAKPKPQALARKPAKPKKAKDGDTDGDGVSNEAEARLGTDPTRADTDGDGLSDKAELQLSTNATKWDTDGDGVEDGMEVALGQTSARVRDPLGQLDIDPRVRGEFVDPVEVERRLGVKHNADTDRDGVADWAEEYRGTDRLVADFDPGGVTNDQSALDQFRASTDQVIGTRYLPGANGDPDNLNPPTLGRAGAVKWVASQAGVDLPDTAWDQYNQLRQQPAARISVDGALGEKGNLVFRFSSDPAKGTPGETQVAITMGNGKVLEPGPNGGFVVADAGTRYTHAVSMSPALMPGDLDGDGVHDADEQFYGPRGLVPQFTTAEDVVDPQGDQLAALSFTGDDPVGGDEIFAAAGADPLRRPQPADAQTAPPGPPQPRPWPRHRDTDRDPFSDGMEPPLPTGPSERPQDDGSDVDRDGIPDGLDPEIAEPTIDADGDGIPDALDADVVSPWGGAFPAVDAGDGDPVAGPLVARGAVDRPAPETASPAVPDLPLETPAMPSAYGDTYDDDSAAGWDDPSADSADDTTYA